MLRFGAMFRDLVGYALRPPDVKWPNDARLAVSLVLNYEEGAELCVGDGDPEGERVGEFVYPSMDSRTRDLGIESTFEYGARVGAWRVLRLFDDYGVKATIYACGRALERNPIIAREFTTRGHETAGHGYRWADHFRMSRDHERDQIQRAVAAIANATGQRPVGWYSRYAPSVHTRELLVEEGGFEYDSDSYADEIPYWVRVDDRPHLVIPYQLDANDAKFFRGPGWSGAGEFCEYLRDSVDYLRREGKTTPRLLSIGLHGRIIGRPGRAMALERFSSTVARCPTSGSPAGSISPAGGVSTTRPDPSASPWRKSPCAHPDWPRSCSRSSLRPGCPPRTHRAPPA